MKFLLVFFGGGIGCLVRSFIGLGFQRTGTFLPWATFVSNVLACMVFGIVIWIVTAKEIVNPNLRLLLLTGFCGGLSTFSSFGYETFLLLKQSMYLYAFLNIMVTTTLCLFIFYVFN
jgi:CrcB protein